MENTNSQCHMKNMQMIPNFEVPNISAIAHNLFNVLSQRGIHNPP